MPVNVSLDNPPSLSLPMGRDKCPRLVNIGEEENVQRISPFDGGRVTNEPKNVQTVPQTDRRTGRHTDMQYAARQTY